MMLHRPDRLLVEKERRVVIYVMLSTVIAVLVLFFVFLLPLRHRRLVVETRIAEVERELLSFWRTRGHMPLHVQADRARDDAIRLRKEWDELRVRVDTFRGESPLAQALSSNEEGRIDFKVALFDARTRLAEKAAEQGVSLPLDLGIPEMIATDEDAEIRRWQLATVYTLMELLIEMDLPVIERIEAVPPVMRLLPDESELEGQEYRVRVTFLCPFEKFLPTLDRLSSEGTTFAVRRFRGEKIERGAAIPLRVTMVCGGILFALPKPPEPEVPLEGPYQPPEQVSGANEEELF